MENLEHEKIKKERSTELLNLSVRNMVNAD